MGVRSLKFEGGRRAALVRGVRVRVKVRVTEHDSAQMVNA